MYTHKYTALLASKQVTKPKNDLLTQLNKDLILSQNPEGMTKSHKYTAAWTESCIQCLLNSVSNNAYITCSKFKIEMVPLSSRHLYNTNNF